MCRRYLPAVSSHSAYTGTTAAPVRSAIRAKPLVEQAGIPKKSTNTPSSSAVLWSARMP